MAKVDNINKALIAEQNLLKEKLIAQKDQEILTKWMREDQIKEEARIAKIKAKGFIGNERGEKEPIWAAVKRKADELGKITSQNSFVQYSTAIMEIVSFLVLKAQAIESENRPGLLTMAWRKTVAKTSLGEKIEKVQSGFLEIVDGAWKQGMLWAGKKTRIIKHEKPVIHYTVQVDERGQLDTVLSINGDVVSHGDEKKMLFDIGVVAWLQDVHHCTFDDTTHTMSLPDGSPLTPDHLKAISVDNDDGLIAFFENREGLTISPKGP